MFPFNEKVFKHRLYQSIRAVYCVPSDVPHFSRPFGSFGGRTVPREIEQTANLFAMSSVQFGRSVGAQSAAAQSCDRGTSQKQAQKKRTFSRPF